MTKNTLNNEDDITFEDEPEESGGMKSKSEGKLRKELKKCHEERQEYLAGWQRAKADLVNFKRESEKSRTRFSQFALEDFMMQLLPVLDSFEAALAHGESGVEQIYKQLLGMLKQNGVEQVDPANESFDPTLHESVATEQVENKKQDNTIVEVIQKGYTLHNKLLRPARVRIGEWKPES